MGGLLGGGGGGGAKGMLAPPCQIIRGGGLAPLPPHPTPSLPTSMESDYVMWVELDRSDAGTKSDIIFGYIYQPPENLMLMKLHRVGRGGPGGGGQPPQ